LEVVHKGLHFFDIAIFGVEFVIEIHKNVLESVEYLTFSHLE